MACILPLPNYINALPIKLFEYMIAELPVIVSNFLPISDMVRKNKCGITVDPLNYTDIARSIKYFMDNPDIAGQMGKNGRRLVVENFNWENESIKLLKVYERLTGN